MRASSLPGKVLVFACALGASLSLAAPAANAITWDFSTQTGDLGTTETYSSGGKTITAAGFTSNSFSTTTDLWGKHDGGDENGLGMRNDSDHEISGSNIVRIALPTGLTGVSFKMNSSTDGEGWAVYGSNSATTGYALLASGTDESSHTLATDSFYYFVATGGHGNNVLLASLSASPVPLPGAALMFGSGLIGLGMLSRRRKKAVEPTAA